MSAESNKESVKKLFRQGINKQDNSVVDEVIGESYVNHGFPGTAPGAEGFKQVLHNFRSAFNDMQITQEDVIAEGDMVAARGKWTGVHTGDFMGLKPTGKKVEVNYMDFWKFSNGKAVENWVQMDMMGLMQQLGITN